MQYYSEASLCSHTAQGGLFCDLCGANWVLYIPVKLRCLQNAFADVGCISSSKDEARAPQTGSNEPQTNKIYSVLQHQSN